MLDKSIPYSNIIMVCPWERVKNAAALTLPNGFTYKTYESGDNSKWAKIEHSVGEFPSIDDAVNYFNEHYMPYEDKMKQRNCYIANEKGEYIATASALWYTDDCGTHPTLGWVAVDPSYQGKGLGKAIVAKALSVHAELDVGCDVVLHTQTWSHKAVRMYYGFGFRLSRSIRFSRFENDYEKSIEILRQRIPTEFVDELASTSVE